MINFKNLLFGDVDMPVLDCEQMANKILDLDDKFSFWDNYRHTKMIPLMTKQGNQGRLGSDNSQEGEFLWLDYTPNLIKEWFEETVFPWTQTKSRIMALITQPGASNYEHIDCEPNEVGSQQHKFRIVLQGHTDTLYFVTDKGNVKAPNTTLPFIMDGGWPHGMNNYTKEVKVTLALGAPWVGNENYSNVNILMQRSDYVLPTDLTPYFKNGGNK